MLIHIIRVSPVECRLPFTAFYEKNGVTTIEA